MEGGCQGLFETLNLSPNQNSKYQRGDGLKIVGNEKKNEERDESIERSVHDFVFNQVKAVRTTLLPLSSALQLFKLHLFMTS